MFEWIFTHGRSSRVGRDQSRRCEILAEPESTQQDAIGFICLFHERFPAKTVENCSDLGSGFQRVASAARRTHKLLRSNSGSDKIREYVVLCFVWVVGIDPRMGALLCPFCSSLLWMRSWAFTKGLAGDDVEKDIIRDMNSFERSFTKGL